MFSENTKTMFFAGWALLVLLVATLMGISSMLNWVAVVCVAIVPPLVVRSFWRVPPQTISESINEARR